MICPIFQEKECLESVELLSTLLYIFIVEKSAYIHTAGYFLDCLWLVDRQSLREPDELFTGNIPGLQDAYTAAESRHLPIKAPSYDLCDDHRTETRCL